MGKLVQDDGCRLPGELWKRLEPLLLERPPHPLGCHNPRVPDHAAMDAIFFVLRTGSQWQALRATGICSPPSAYWRFREWIDGKHPLSAAVRQLSSARGLPSIPRAEVSLRQVWGMSLTRASTLASHVWGSTSLSFAVVIRPYMIAARCPPRSDPQNSHAFRPKAILREHRRAGEGCGGGEMMGERRCWMGG